MLVSVTDVRKTVQFVRGVKNPLTSITSSICARYPELLRSKIPFSKYLNLGNHLIVAVPIVVVVALRHLAVRWQHLPVCRMKTSGARLEPVADRPIGAILLRLPAVENTAEGDTLDAGGPEEAVQALEGPRAWPVSRFASLAVRAPEGWPVEAWLDWPWFRSHASVARGPEGAARCHDPCWMVGRREEEGEELGAPEAPAKPLSLLWRQNQCNPESWHLWPIHEQIGNL